MIRVHVSVVCRVRDGFTGQILSCSALQCALDGARCCPVIKPGGYLALTNLPAGAHRLSLRCPGYQEEWVEFSAGRDDTQELDVTMKPGRDYPFRQDVIRLRLVLTERGTPAAGRLLWLAAPGQTELKIAQTKVEAGSMSLRLFTKGAVLSVPGTYLIADGKNSEIVLLRALEGEQGELHAPLAFSHSRSRSLLPAQRYHTDEEGVLTAVFREPCTVEVCGLGGELLDSIALTRGEVQRTVYL